jgi:ribonucleoside-diphosphate reductase alpha chain
MRFEPQGYTKNPDIRIAKSLIDYIFRWLGITFLAGYKEASMGVLPSDSSAPGSAGGSDDTESHSGPVAKKAGGRKQSDIKSRKTTSETESAAAEKLKNGSAGPSTKPTAPGSAGGSSMKPQAKTNGHANSHTNGHSNGNGNGLGEISTALLARAGIMPKDAGPNTARSEQFADFQSDAPACDSCGSITVRAGNCYLCHNCGSSMGCS